MKITEITYEEFIDSEIKKPSNYYIRNALGAYTFFHSRDRGFIPALDVVEPFVYDGDEVKLRALVEELTERPAVVTEDYIDSSHPSEGIIIRADRGSQTPLFLKSKSFAFRVLEGIASDTSVDEEDAS